MLRICNATRTRRGHAQRALWLGLALVMTLGVLQAKDEPPAKLTTPELLNQFASANPHDQLDLMPKLIQPATAADFEHYKIPEFLIRVLKDTGADPRVRHAALEGMVLAIVKYDTAYRAQFIPAFLDVLNEKSVGLIQEYVLIASPAAVDPSGPGPNMLLLKKIASIAEDSKMTSDNELRLRVQAIVALGEIGNKDYLEKFFKLMSDSNPAVVIGSIKAVEKFLNTSGAADLELTVPQLAVLTNLLKNKETSLDGKAAILRTMGVNARNFRRSHPNNQLSPGVNEVMAEITTMLNPAEGQALPPYYVVGACIETLGMYGHKDALTLLKLIFTWPYLKSADGQPYRVKAVNVLDQIISNNIGDGKTYNQVVEDLATVLKDLIDDDKEDAQVRQAAAFYLADVRFKCYKRDVYFDCFFRHAYAPPDAKEGALDPALLNVCRQSMEVLAGRTFPVDWVYSDFVNWWLKVGKTELAQQK